MLGIFHDLVQNTLAQRNRRRTTVRFNLKTATLNSSQLGMDGITRQ
jgi:hypothetical protein